MPLLQIPEKPLTVVFWRSYNKVMNKQVTFIARDERRLQICKGQTWQCPAEKRLVSRSAGNRYYQNQKYTTPDSASGKSEDKNVGKNRTMSAPVAQVKTIHIPKSMMTASFLKHPDLTPGQKRYLWSIAKIYSTNWMRTLMKRQYTNLSHHYKQLGLLKCTGLTVPQENQAKAQASQRQRSWIKRKKTPQRGVKPALTPSSTGQSPIARNGNSTPSHTEDSKQRLQSGALLKTRNKSQKSLQPPRKREPLTQSGSADQAASKGSEQKTEEESLSESMNSISLEAEKGH
ncbi:protein FAM216A [Rhinatrema bivittatum]|uniref:protein FAM216A n=1 Tax=Rhinatrema bivittatum TaxID=194408 RepID=UPI00112A172C|nr:protein FAM216A [Rhinatrema bivittatum]